MATFTIGSDGQMVASQGPTLQLGHTQNITGGILEAASSKTIASQQMQSDTAKSLGAGQKGAGRRKSLRRDKLSLRRDKLSLRRKSVRRGGAAPNLNVNIVELPTANSISGVSHETNHINAIDNLNQLRANSVYDGLANATPRMIGGKHKRKAKNGSRHNRTHRRKRSKSSHRSRRCRHNMV
jgi:hypothetical protein